MKIQFSIFKFWKRKYFSLNPVFNRKKNWNSDHVKFEKWISVWKQLVVELTSSIIYVQDMTRFIQSWMIYDQISMVVTVFYNLYTRLWIKIAKFLYIFIPEKINDIRLIITSEFSFSWPGIVQIFREILVDFYIGKWLSSLRQVGI